MVLSSLLSLAVAFLYSTRIVRVQLAIILFPNLGKKNFQAQSFTICFFFPYICLSLAKKQINIKLFNIFHWIGMICVIQAPFIYKKRKFKRRSVQDAVVLISTRFLLGMIRPLTFLGLYIFSREMGTA